MTAKYLQIAREIKKRIISQQYPASAPLPDQFALAAGVQHQPDDHPAGDAPVNRRRADLYPKRAGHLVRKNFLQLSQWSCPAATISAPPKPGSILARCKAKWCALRCAFPATRSKVRCLSTPMPRWYDFVRLRLLNGEPVSLDLTVMPVGLVPGLTKSHLEGSVFRYVQETLGG